uniref:Uncharacterized protein n=1 Tax=Ditylenchus dipsaci TaxID=166011 RepID=A0A915D514_9BILA
MSRLRCAVNPSHKLSVNECQRKKKTLGDDAADRPSRNRVLPAGQRLSPSYPSSMPNSTICSRGRHTI